MDALVDYHRRHPDHFLSEFARRRLPLVPLLRELSALDAENPASPLHGRWLEALDRWGHRPAEDVFLAPSDPAPRRRRRR